MAVNKLTAKNFRLIPKDNDLLDRTTGSRGDIVYDQTNQTLRFFDGKRVGGYSVIAETNILNTIENLGISTIDFKVTIASPQSPDTGNKYRINGEYKPELNLVVGTTYIFDQSDLSNVYYPNSNGTTANPHPLNFGIINNLKIHNTTVQGDVDYVRFTVGSKPITKLFLTKYSGVDPIAFFAIQEGSSWTAGQNTGQMLTYSHFGPLVSGYGIGDNILAPTETVLEANTTYTMWIQQTGVNITEYAFSTDPLYQGESTVPADYSSSAGSPTALIYNNSVPYLNNVIYKLDGEEVTYQVYNSEEYNSATNRSVQITVTSETPENLFYWCWNHLNMGNDISVANPGSGTGQGGLVQETPAIKEIHVAGQDNIVAQTPEDYVNFVAGSGITITTNSSTDSITFNNTGILNIEAGAGISLSLDSGTATISSDLSIGNLHISNTGEIESIDSSNIKFLQAVEFESDLIVKNELVFPDGTKQTTAAGPTPGPEGPQGPQGPAGPVGEGAGDVITLNSIATDNAIVRYHEATGTIIQNSSATINDAGVITAAGFSGSGTSLTGLNASNLASGTIPDGRFPATLPAASGANLTALNANNLGSGTIPNSRFPATLPTASGVNLTSLNASNLASGTVPVERIGASGTRDSTTYLRGDNTWVTIAGIGGGTNSFATISIAGQNNVVADSSTDTLTFVAGSGIQLTTDDTTDTITIASTVSASNSFGTFIVAGSNNVVADQAGDSVTLIAGSGISITTNNDTDTITIENTVSGGSTTFGGLNDVTASTTTIDMIHLPAITMLEVTNIGNSSYRFDQYGTTDNPTIYAISGTTIAFKLNCPGHPFLIQNGAGVNYNTGLIHIDGSGNRTTGASAQGRQSGTLYWKVPIDISGGYRYQCSAHAPMVGSITIKSFSIL